MRLRYERRLDTLEQQLMPDVGENVDLHFVREEDGVMRFDGRVINLEELKELERRGLVIILRRVPIPVPDWSKTARKDT